MTNQTPRGIHIPAALASKIEQEAYHRGFAAGQREAAAEIASLREQTTNAGALRERVRKRLDRINKPVTEGGDYSVIEMVADMEKLLAVQWSGKCYREGCQAGNIS